MKEQFDGVEAMNKAGFVEFLAQFKDAESFDANDAEALEVRYKAFQNKAETSKRLSSMIRSEAGLKDLGIEFTDAELEPHIGGRVEEIAHENPEKINELFDAMKEFQTLTNEVAEAEKRIAKLTESGDLEASVKELKKKQETLETAAETERFFTGGGSWGSRMAASYEKFTFGHAVDFAKDWLKKNPGEPEVGSRKEMENFVTENSGSRRRHEARLTVKNDYSIELDGDAIEAELEKTKTEIEARSAQLDALGELEKQHADAKERFAEIREMILAGVGTNEGLRDLAKKKASDRLSALIKSDPEKAMVFFGDLQKASGEPRFGINYVEGKEAELQKEIEVRIDERVTADLKNVIEKTPFGTKAYDKLMKSLEAFVGKQKIGTKEGDVARAFILDTLKKVADEISPADKARGLLVRFALARISAASK
ncbi:MAG: hypothetical protein WC763_01635 [Candidatus Paceibacterota bacterium]|jgi:hypothetical protein